MAWVFDAIDVKWFLDNFGDTIQAILDGIIAIIKKLLEGGAQEEETAEE